MAQATNDKPTMDELHRKAELIRADYGYSGGSDGSEYLPLGQEGAFNYRAAPSYTDKYGDEIDELLGQILRRDDFS